MQKIIYQPGSFFQVPNREAYRQLKPNAKVVYVALCDYSDDSGASYPSRKTLAKDTGISVRSVDGAIKELVAAGMVEKRTRVIANNQSSNIYQLMIVATDEGGAAPARGGAADTPTGAANNTQTITTEPKPVNDTLTEVSGQEPQEFGDPNINKMVQVFEEANGTKLRLITKQRRAAARIIKRCGSPEKALGVCQAAVACRNDKYAPAIANLLDLDEKLDKLALYYRKRDANKSTVKTGVVV